MRRVAICREGGTALFLSVLATLLLPVAARDINKSDESTVIRIQNEEPSPVSPSHEPVTKLNVTVPAVIPTDSQELVPMYVLGENFQEPSYYGYDMRCVIHVGEWNRPDKYGTNGTGIFVNSSAILCMMPNEMVATNNLTVDIALNGNRTYSGGTRANFTYVTLVEATVERRTYLSNETDQMAILVWPDFAAIRAYGNTSSTDRMVVCWSVDDHAGGEGPNGCQRIPLNITQSESSAIVVPFGIHPGVTSLDTVVYIDVSLYHGDCLTGFQLATKQRRLVIAPATGLQGSFTTVDHRRRMLRVNGRPFLGTGFYSTVVAAQPGFPLQRALDDLTALGQMGINQMQLYGLEDLDDQDLEKVVGVLEQQGIYFGFSLVREVTALLNTTLGFNSTGTWANITRSVNRIKDSRMLLGYYICDDCNRPAVFPLEGLAKLYTGLKGLDPHHVTLGATWSVPWALYAFGESGGFLSLDYPMVENYLYQPGYHLDDGRLRKGMAFEPIVNSPPMYLLEGEDIGLPGGARLPPALEASLAWMGALCYGAPGVQNYVFMPPASAPPAGIGVDRWGWQHVASTAKYALLAERLAPVLLPDLTNNGTFGFARLAGGPYGEPAGGLRVRVATAGTRKCQVDNVLPAIAGHPERVVEGVIAMGSAWAGWTDASGKESFCGIVAVVNPCVTPLQYSLEVSGVPASVQQAHHLFGPVYNVTLGGSCGPHAAADGCARELTDIVGGYETAVFRLGCEGWRDDE